MRSSITRSFLHACMVLTAVAFAGQAMADEEGNDSGPYIGVGGGQFNVKIENATGVTDVIGDLSTDDVAWKAFFGWRFMRYLSLEGDYIDLGTPRGNFEASGSNGNYSLDISGFGTYLIGTLPISIFELQAKVGYYWNDVKLNVNLNNVGPENGNVLHTNNHGEAWTYGVGAGVTAFDHLHFLLEYEYMDLQRDLKDPYVVWASAAWRF